MMMRKRGQRLLLNWLALLIVRMLTHPALAQDGGFSSQQARLVAATSTGTAQ